MINLIPELIDYTTPRGPNDILFFTANQVVKANGELVLGAGNAKAVRDNVSGSAKAFGERLGDQRVCTLDFEGLKIGALVTKQHFKHKSDLEFVKESLRHLYRFAKSNPGLTLHIPYPAIGHGGLTREVLDPIMELMPGNIKIYINPKDY